jgi:PAS domain S-box-containing protein
MIDGHFRDALLETIPCAVFMVDREHRVIYWNRSAEELTGYSAEEVVGNGCDKLRLNICASTDPAVRKTFCPLLSETGGGEVECEMRTKKGQVVPVMRRSRAVLDDNGEIIGAIEALIDVSLIKKARNEIRLLKHEIAKRGRYGELVGQSDKMRKLYEIIEVVARNDANVIIEGETGTGKELVAKTIHAESERAEKIFLPVNCAALPDALVEAELFGHKKGAFTGAVADREGCFETAAGGTVFLDEIPELPLSSQVKLLRVLQERQVVRVGESLPRHIDVRVIAASNRPLAQMVERGLFREDLYYRLRVVALRVPSLRERMEDTQDLIAHFIEQYNDEYNKKIQGCSPDAMAAMMEYNWPGNVRELEHVIEHSFAVTPASQKVITLESLPIEVKQQQSKTDGNKQTKNSQSKNPDTKTLDRKPHKDEKSELIEALQKADGNKTKAAKILGITRAGLYKKIKRLGISTRRVI